MLVIIVFNTEQLLLKFLLLFIYSYMYILARLTSEIEFMRFISYGMFISIREISRIVTALASCVLQRLSTGADGHL